MSNPFLLCLHLGLKLGSDRGPAWKGRGLLTGWQEETWWDVQLPSGSSWEA